MGLLTQVDMAAFARWKEAEEFISKHGSILKTSSGYIQQSIYCATKPETDEKLLFKTWSKSICKEQAEYQQCR